MQGQRCQLPPAPRLFGFNSKSLRKHEENYVFHFSKRSYFWAYSEFAGLMLVNTNFGSWKALQRKRVGLRAPVTLLFNLGHHIHHPQETRSLISLIGPQ